MKVRALLLAAALVADGARAADLPTLWAARVKCTVAVEYVTQTELERRPTVSYGTVIDTQGTIILPSAAIDLRISPKQLKDFKVYLPGDPEGTAAEYLGRDSYTGWHFVRAGASVRDRLVPVTAFVAAGAPHVPQLSDEVWGIGLRNKDEDFTPYILQSHVALIQSLPQRTAIAQQEVAGPGLPVFNKAGEFMGLGSSSFGQTFLEFSGAERDGAPIMLVNLEESSAFLVADEVIPYLGRIPENVFGRPLAWLGAYGLEPMDREVASFLKLQSQSGAVVSEVLEGSPAEKAGLKAHDIILGVDGKALPRFTPDRVVVDYVERLISSRVPGDMMTLSVLR
ncbi:MAG TPA: PDZ domain-containing protein, partial [Opitutaceae bacterium]